MAAIQRAANRDRFTGWTVLADLPRKLYFIRAYGSLNFTRVYLGALTDAQNPAMIPLHNLNVVVDATAMLESTA